MLITCLKEIKHSNLKSNLLLYKVLNLKELVTNWLTLNFTQTLMSRQTKFIALRSNNFQSGEQFAL